MSAEDLVFLKLGGSLITEKDQPFTARLDIIQRLAAEIASVLSSSPDLQLVLGHGSGSFGHIAAQKYGTRQGVRTRAEWHGFVEVWQEARQLNEIVLRALLKAGLPVIAFPPSSAVLASEGKVLRWDMGPLRAALSAGLVPLINGDTVFDSTRGGTILSTEDLFNYLAHHLKPQRILLAGLEPGVWEDYPTCSRLVEVITPHTFYAVRGGIGGSSSVDVTGGMIQKVESMLSLADEIPDLEAQIFSGAEPDILKQALQGAHPGTTIRKSI